MTKYLVTASTQKVIFRKLGKVNRPIAMVYSRLYRIDDELCSSADDRPDSFVYYDLEEQQPYGHGDYLDPDFTKAMIDSMKISRGKPTKLFDMDLEKIMIVIVVGVVLFSMVSTYLG